MTLHIISTPSPGPRLLVTVVDSIYTCTGVEVTILTTHGTISTHQTDSEVIVGIGTYPMIKVIIYLRASAKSGWQIRITLEEV